jgi:hypothetical protein
MIISTFLPEITIERISRYPGNRIKIILPGFRSIEVTL